MPEQRQPAARHWVRARYTVSIDEALATLIEPASGRHVTAVPWPAHDRHVVASFDQAEQQATTLLASVRATWFRPILTIHYHGQHHGRLIDIDRRVLRNVFLNAGAHQVTIAE